MTGPTQTNEQLASKLDQVLINGDLATLSPHERVAYYNSVCESLGLNPKTKPFDYIKLNGKLTLYARKDCTEQLRARDEVAVIESSEKEFKGIFVVMVKVRNKHGREDIARGAVPIEGLKGEQLANAILKAETKAKRRATLSICGLGFLDESEVESLRDENSTAQPSRDTSQALPSPTESQPALSDSWKDTKHPSSPQLKRLQAIRARALLSEAALLNYVKEAYRKDKLESLTIREYEAICDEYLAGGGHHKRAIDAASSALKSAVKGSRIDEWSPLETETPTGSDFCGEGK